MNFKDNAIQIIKENSFKDISIGYSDLNFTTRDTFEKFQIGFRTDTNGISLIEDKDGSWKDQWYVIATDQHGDPIIYDCEDKKLYTSIIGTGSWKLNCISSSVSSFKKIVDFLDKISFKRKNPVQLENNPFSQAELNKLNQLINNDDEIFSEYWLIMLETD